MATISNKDLDAYISHLEKLGASTQGAAKAAIYDGAGVMIEEVKAGIQSWPTKKNPHDGMTDQEKKDLVSGIGISKFNDTGGINVKIGFAGYGSHPTDTWPQGVPVPLTARTLIKGCSWRLKDDFMTRTVSKAKKKVMETIEKTFDKKIEEIFKE